MTCALLAWEPVAHAEPKEDPDALFEEGNKLMDSGRDAEACPLFERSLALDPSLGTRLNLAICYEKIGRLGSANRLFREVAQVAHDTGKTKREEVAKEHLATLRTSASFVSITIADPSSDPVVRIDGIEVMRDDYAFTALDPGEHSIEAIASRKKPFATKVTIAEGRGEKHEITIPVLEAEVIVQKKVETVVNTRRTAAYIAAGAGVVGLATAVVTGIMVSSAQSTADDHCTRAIPNSDKLGCDADGSSAVKRGQTLIPINAVAVGVAVVGLGVGSYLFFTSSPRTPATTPAVAVSPAVGPGSVGVVGRF
jgi:hypothetical protein